MAKLLQSMGRLEEARPLAEEMLRTQRATLGDYHQDTLLSIFYLADLLERQDRLTEAIPLFTELLAGSDTVQAIQVVAEYGNQPNQSATQGRPAKGG